MARSVITKPAKLKRLSALVGRPIIRAFARGNTDHRIDAIEDDLTIWHVFRDGTIEKSEWKAHDWRRSVTETPPTAASQNTSHD